MFDEKSLPSLSYELFTEICHPAVIRDPRFAVYRYRDWYHTNFAVDTETEYRKKKRRGGAAADSDDGGCKCLLLTLLVLLVAIWLGEIFSFLLFAL